MKELTRRELRELKNKYLERIKTLNNKFIYDPNIVQDLKPTIVTNLLVELGFDEVVDEYNKLP